MPPPPVTYFVVGKAGDEEFAKAENLAESLMSALPAVTCHIHPTLPDAWPALCKTTCARLGCKEVHPVVWTGTGRLVGSLGEFEKECMDKYDVRVDPEIRGSTWAAIAKESLRNAEAAAAGPTGVVYPEGEGRGPAVTDALLTGHDRFLAGSSDSSVAPSATVDAAIVLLAPLPGGLTPPQLLDTPKQNLFVLPCPTPKLDAIAVGNIEHAVMVLGCRSLWLIAAESAEVAAALEGVKASLAGKDVPLAPGPRASVEVFRHAMERLLAVADPAASDAELNQLALQEWVRECQDELMHESAVLHELQLSGGLHIVRAVCEAPSGKLALV